MITDPQRLLALFDRGVSTETELVIRLVEAATVISPVCLAAAIPAEMAERIRALAALPRAPRWIQIRSVCNSPCMTPEQLQAERDAEHWMWLEGLARWRDYFQAVGDSRPSG